uniref:Uncharacterized protein n=1 Tax=Chromera velia CCMP2878 TaxID=1169474 RepID=A0A0G4FMX1_9ALVE|eukprot:Cvel_17863.t1-p1 / transcript=Cvel_17863.t1 / gene=Cvel_17863 / organism=Chromera_velia_CCMP2878 / gene_product=hypothetical protein / transcript_product=hypothetical protein / location=Cvel_scaffold1449:3718-4113(-) / protein_length=132 / sequence_SO=supercontig / SO=protein_coding / is_pseudo=false
MGVWALNKLAWCRSGGERNGRRRRWSPDPSSVRSQTLIDPTRPHPHLPQEGDRSDREMTHRHHQPLQQGGGSSEEGMSPMEKCSRSPILRGKRRVMALRALGPERSWGRGKRSEPPPYRHITDPSEAMRQVV